MVKSKLDAAGPPLFKTQFPMRCAGCGDMHPAGTQATYQGQDNNLIAEECLGMEPVQRNETVEPGDEAYLPTEEERVEARKRMCDKCWIILPLSGICGSCF